MTQSRSERALRFGRHIAQTGATVRETAAVYGMSKSTVHKEVHTRLRTLNPVLYAQVKAVLQQHLDVRHLRGGAATAARYQRLRDEQESAPS